MESNAWSAGLQTGESGRRELAGVTQRPLYVACMLSEDAGHHRNAAGAGTGVEGREAGGAGGRGEGSTGELLRLLTAEEENEGVQEGSRAHSSIY